VKEQKNSNSRHCSGSEIFIEMQLTGWILQKEKYPINVKFSQQTFYGTSLSNF